MNTLQIIRALKGIYADYIDKGRKACVADNVMLDEIIRMYNNVPELDFPEVKWLWINWLEKAELNCPEAVRLAWKRLYSERGGVCYA